MIAVDSTVWIDYLRGRPTPQVVSLRAAIQRQPDGVALIDVVLTEVLRGLADKDVKRVEQQLTKHDVLRLEWIRDFRAAAGLYRAARKSGVTIRSTVDCLIAAICIRENVTLLHNDADFDRLAEISELSTIRVR
jgi:predicted nucleic acid-binding protein